MVGNIAFTSLIVLLLAIPGYMLRKFYYADQFSKEVLSRSLTEEIYQSILYSIPFHVVAVLLVDWAYLAGLTRVYVDYEILLGLLSGKTISYDGIDRTSESFDHYLGYVAAYFGITATVAMLMGVALRQLVWHYKLDVRFLSLRFPNRWLYTFTGRDWDTKQDEYQLIILDAMCTLTKEKTRLYRGVVFAFDTNTRGDLEQIHLGTCARGHSNSKA